MLGAPKPSLAAGDLREEFIASGLDAKQEVVVEREVDGVGVLYGLRVVCPAQLEHRAAEFPGAGLGAGQTGGLEVGGLDTDAVGATAALLGLAEIEALVDDDVDNSSDEEADRRHSLAALREERLAQVEALHRDGLGLLRELGMKRLETEGMGDCWLIAFIADSLPAKLIAGFTDDERKLHLSVWRKELVRFTLDVGNSCTSLAAEPQPIGQQYLYDVAYLFNVEQSVIGCIDSDGARGNDGTWYIICVIRGICCDICDDESKLAALNPSPKCIHP